MPNLACAYGVYSSIFPSALLHFFSRMQCRSHYKSIANNIATGLELTSQQRQLTERDI